MSKSTLGFFIITIIILNGCSSIPPPNLPEPSKFAPEPTEIEMQMIGEGNNLHDKGKYKQALEKYYNVLNLNPNNIVAMYEIAYTYKELENYDSVFKYLFKGLEYKTELSPILYDMLGTCYDEKNHPDYAIKVYEKGIEVKPFYLLYFNLAVTQLRMEQFEIAESNLEKSIEMNPLHPGSNYTLSNLYFHKNRRMPSMLSSFKFLLLEPNTERSNYAMNTIFHLVFSSVQKKQGVTTLFISPDTTNNFAAMEFSLSASIALGNFKDDLETGNKLKLIQRILKEILPHIEDNKNDFISIYFLKFFKNLKDKEFEEVMPYYIMQNSDVGEVHDWIFDNKEKISEFENWFKNFDYSADKAE